MSLRPFVDQFETTLGQSTAMSYIKTYVGPEGLAGFMNDGTLLRYASLIRDGQEQRVKDELDAFKKMDMMNLLKFLHFLVTFMKQNKIVWGVGRGSSVASYVLFLLGVHKVNSIQYNLDWQEFLR